MLRLLIVTMLLLACPAFAHPTPPPYVPVRYGHDALASVLAAHRLACGTVTNEADFSEDSTHGNLWAFARDLCRGTAAALLGDADRASLIGFPDEASGLRALREKQIDVLWGATPDSTTALAYGVDYAPTAFFDSQGFMVNQALGVSKPADLTGKLLCSITGTPAEARAMAWRAASGVTFAAQAYTEQGEMSAALEGGKCAAITADVSALSDMRRGFARPAHEFPILPQRIAIDPWAPAVRAGEVRLRVVVSDVLAALIADEARGTGVPDWFGATPGIAATLGMPNGWAARAIAVGGNYGVLFTHDFGGLERGPDALWNAGGLLTPPIIR